METVLAELGWTMESDIPRWGLRGKLPPGRCEWDCLLEKVAPELTQLRVGGGTMLQDAQRYGWHWVSQLINAEGEFVDPPRGEHARAVWGRWCAVLSGDDGQVSECWKAWLHDQAGNRCTQRDSEERMREYELCARTAAVQGGGELICTSDGSLKHGRASFMMVPVQGGGA